MLGTLFELEWKRSQRYFGKQKVARIFIIVLFLAMLLAIAASVYFLFERGLSYIATFPYAADALSLYVYELTFFIIGMFVCASALISGTFRLFRGEYDFWILATPQYEQLPLHVFVENFITSLWPLILIGVPALLAMQSVFHLTFFNFCAVFLALVALGIFAVALAFDLLLLVGTMLVEWNAKALFSILIFVVGVFFALGAWLFWQEVRAIGNIEQFFPGLASLTPRIDTSLIAAHFHFLPTHPIAEVLLLAQQNGGGVLAYLCLSFVLAFSALAFFLIFVPRHLKIWQRTQEQTFNAGAMVEKSSGKSFIFSVDDIDAVLLEKELILFWRNKRDLLWLAFLSLLWLLQIFFDLIIRTTSLTYGAHLTDASSWIQALQIVVLVYFLSIFVLRFVFPLFSAEHERAWFIGSVPISLRRLFTAKLIFFNLLFIGFAAIASVLHAILLSVPFALSLVLFLLAITMAAALVALGFALGVIFPNFETSDPEILSTSLPGLSYIALSLAYGALGALTFKYYLTSGLLWAALFFIFCSILVATLLVHLSWEKLERFSFEF